MEMMFDTTACGEYKSFNTQHMSQHPSQRQLDDEEDEDEDSEDGDIDGRLLCVCQDEILCLTLVSCSRLFLSSHTGQDPDETTLSQIRGNKNR